MNGRTWVNHPLRFLYSRIDRTSPVFGRNAAGNLAFMQSTSSLELTLDGLQGCYSIFCISNRVIFPRSAIL
jgi:hypothetical protein